MIGHWWGGVMGRVCCGGICRECEREWYDDGLKLDVIDTCIVSLFISLIAVLRRIEQKTSCP